MKCIPKWENCDKCSCGILGDGNRCRFKSKGQRVTDDRYSVNCNSRETVKINPLKSGKISFEPFDIKGGNGKKKDKKNRNKNKDKKNKNKNKDKKDKNKNKDKKKKKGKELPMIDIPSIVNSRETVTINPLKGGKISFNPFDIKGGNGKNKNKNKDKKKKNKNKDKKKKNKNKDKKKKKGNKKKKKKKRMISGDSMDHSPFDHSPVKAAE
eukprot:CAMPEP_0171323238 /NCGR_PEP_ID=MMETSP0816-20121228/115452_1 /TAXON_ID=420281 /ORGANISM="Proboscia inermis, Strain CCAP1064/1" /LENGTH=209 /DNA_ID=CAMNT_0011821903 /DNA_START=953 /DNA_END=1581 /DNA_ORIENTATION=-